MKDIENRVKMIKEQVVDKIDLHFNDYQMVNIETHTNIDSVIDDQDWYEYWKEVSFDIKVLLGDILELVETHEYNKDPHVNELLKEAFEYKLLCDKNITSNKHYSRKDFEDQAGGTCEGLDLEPLSPIKVSIEKHKDTITQIIYNYLAEHDFINDVEFEDFNKLFSHHDERLLIQWRSDAIMFVAFINLMLDKNIFSLPHEFKDKCWEYFAKIFIRENGNQFSTKLLGNRKTQSTYDKKQQLFREELLPLLAPYLL